MTAIQHSAIGELHEALERANERAAGALSVHEHGALRQVTVWMEPASAPAVEACLGTAVTGDPGTFAGSDPAILRLGPEEWLIVGERDVEPGLRAALTGRRDAVVDVSDQRTTLELRGARAREILAGGCSIDLHPDAFGAGRCAETTLARAGVILVALDDAPAYRLLVRRSFAAYVVTWLLDAMIELGHPV